MAKQPTPPPPEAVKPDPPPAPPREAWWGLEPRTPKPEPDAYRAIDEARTALGHLEAELSEMVTRFEQETGLQVVSLDLQKAEATRIGDHHRRFLTRVRARAEVVA